MTIKYVSAEVPNYLSVLESTPRQLEEIANQEGEGELENTPSEGGWSAKEILAHLCSCQDVWSYSIYAMLAVDNPLLYHLHPRKLAATMKYEDLSFDKVLSHFKSGREQLLRILQKLPQENWVREATIKGRQHSVFSQVRRMAIHETDHWEQFESILRQV